MKQATRRFLQYRPGAEFIERVEHRPNPQYRVGHCIEQAMKVESTDRDEGLSYADSIKYVPGWIIGDYHNGATAIMFHYFNLDADGKYYDTLYHMDQKYEYVMDLDVDDPVKHKGEYYWPPALKMTDDRLIALLGSDAATKAWDQVGHYDLGITDLLDLKHLIKLNISYLQSIEPKVVA